MAQIIENSKGRRSVKLNVDDIITVVREYQNITKCETCYFSIRKKLLEAEFYLPEDV